MKKYFLLAIFVCILYNLTIAQTTWQGKILDENNTPLEYVNVLLLNAQDSIFQKGALTNKEGNFSITSDNSNDEMLKISFLGYEDKFVELPKSSPNESLGNIVLSEDVLALNEVEVVAKKPLFEQQIDRTIVNVENSVVNVGNSALAILSRSPSVLIDRNNEEIQLMGNQGIVVMIDDKPLRMEEAELISFLESMPSDNIKNIELITNPPSSYDAQGNAGIININSKREEQNGLIGNASVNAGYGAQPKYGGSFNLNYKENKFNIYTNLSANIDDSVLDFNGTSKFKVGESTIETDRYTLRDSQVGLYSGEVGLDYQLLKNHSVGASFSTYVRDWRLDSYAYGGRITDGEPVTIENNANEVNHLFRTLSNVNYKFQITPNRHLSMDYDYITFKRRNPSDYLINMTMSDLTEQELFFKSSGNTPLNIQVAAINYNDKPTPSLELETGVKWTTSFLENRLNFEEVLNGELVSNPFFKNNFLMDENIYAAYVSAGWNIAKQLQFKGGLRYEYYQIDLNSSKDGDVLHRKNGRLYPNLFLKYSLSENADLNLSYSERVERPGFLILAPFFYFFDQFTLLTGNPTIIPTISKRIKFDMRYKTFNLNVLYAKSLDPVFDGQPDIDHETGIYIIRPLQAKEGNTLSVSASLPVQISEKWSSRINANFNRLDQRPIIAGITFRNTSFNYNFLVTNNYQLFENLELELNGQYFSKFQNSVATIQARWGLDFGLRKKFGGGQSLAFNVADIFNTFSIWDANFNAPEANVQWNGIGNFEGPIFRLSFSTSFGNKNLKLGDKRTSKSSEEQQRLN